MYVVDCHDCPETHEAEYSHQDRYRPHVKVYAVVCGEFIEHYTDEVVYER